MVTKNEWMDTWRKQLNCSKCDKEIKPGESAYEVRSGTIDQDGTFARTDLQSQHSHIECMCCK